MEKPNFYARLPVDRQSERRRDGSFVSERLAAPTARLVVVWRTRNLVLTGDSPAARFLEPGRLAHLDGPRIYLGDLDGTPYFALDVSALEEADLPRAFPALAAEKRTAPAPSQPPPAANDAEAGSSSGSEAPLPPPPPPGAAGEERPIASEKKLGG